MAPKIERVWGTLFGQTAIRRKDQAEKDDSRDQKQNDQRKEEKASDEEARASREDVEKAIRELGQNAQFTGSGMRAEMVQTASGLQVQLSQASGVPIRLISAEEFLKLREAAGAKDETRGKILDQKF